MDNTDIEKIAVKTSIVTIIANFALTVFKLLAGIFGASMALISDAVHSASDVFSTVIVLIGVKVSAKKADKRHQFGHERYECVAAVILAMVLLATGAGIGYTGIKNIVTGEYLNFETPRIIALVAAAVSIVVKEIMFWYTIVAAKKVNSSALKADAWHHRTDALFVNRKPYRRRRCDLRSARFGQRCVPCDLPDDYYCRRQNIYRRDKQNDRRSVRRKDGG